jgi:hypothetical protein
MIDIVDPPNIFRCGRVADMCRGNQATRRSTRRRRWGWADEDVEARNDSGEPARQGHRQALTRIAANTASDAAPRADEGKPRGRARARAAEV